MSLVLNIKKVFALTSVLFLLTACGGGANSSTATTASSSHSTIETTASTAKAIHSGQVKDSSTGTGLENVKVSLGESTTTTDENGFYELSNLITSKEATVNFEKEGYLLGSTQIQLKSLSGDNTTSPNYLEYSLSAYSDAWTNGREWTYESQNGAAGGAVEVPADAIHTDASGAVYNGIVSARCVFKKPNRPDGRDTFPGVFKGINTNGVLVPFCLLCTYIIRIKRRKKCFPERIRAYHVSTSFTHRNNPKHSSSLVL